MKDKFTEALLKNVQSRIPKEYDWYAPLIGDWDFDYYDDLESDVPRHVVGEWMFRKILEGTVIEDLFICPSRETRFTYPQEDGEYGVALRQFNKKDKCYDMVYTTEEYRIHVKWEKVGGNLVGDE